MPEAPQPGRLYIAIEAPLIKVGWTGQQLRDRQAQLKGEIICAWPGTSCRARHWKWAPVGCCDEHSLHRRLARWHVGHERFQVPRTVADYNLIRRLLEQHGDVAAAAKFNALVMQVFGATWRPAA